MYKQQILSVGIVVLIAIALGIWSSACTSGDSGVDGGGGPGRLSASPPSVSVPVNTNATVTVSGGSASYAVQTPPDTSIARIISLINNTVGSPPAAIATVTIHGVRVDSVGTSTTIRDGSSPARTVTIPIRVTP